jgi:ATP-dependent helicase HrpA
VAVLQRADAGENTGRLRWLVEEFRVSLFAQTLGTAEPVSPVNLDRELAAARGRLDPGAAPRPAAAPVGPPARGISVKSLGALDRLFPRE